MKKHQIAALCATGIITVLTTSPALALDPPTTPATPVANGTISDAECARLLADENALVSTPASEEVPIWDIRPPAPTPSPSASASGTPSPSPSMTSSPVVQPVPSGTPTTTPTGTPSGTPTSAPTSTPTPKPTTPPVTTSPGGSAPYMKNPPTTGMRVTSAVHDGVTVRYYRAGSTDPAYRQNLAAVKSYPAPSGGGVVRTVGGQKILAKSSATKLDGLDSHIINIIDEINLTAAALGLPDPVVTAGHDQAGHSANSDHYTGDALDLRCNAVGASKCKQWVVSLANALGPGYDVIFEDYGNANSHVHVAWTR